MSYYNRYVEYVVNGDYIMVPHITLDTKSSDRETIYKSGKSRLDKLSQQYYDCSEKIAFKPIRVIFRIFVTSFIYFSFKEYF